LNELEAINCDANGPRLPWLVRDWLGWTNCLDMRVDTIAVRGNLGSWKSATPVAALDSA
jgi:hypothetical protein